MTPRPFDARELIRWAACAGVAVMAHAALALAYVNWTDEPDDGDEPSGAFVVELAPLAVARADIPAETPPGPDQVQAEAAPKAEAEKQTEKPEETPPPVPQEEPIPQLAKVENPEVALPPARKEPEKQPEQSSEPQMAAPLTTAAQAIAGEQGEVAQAPVQAAPKVVNSDALPRWQRRIETALERNKRYPGLAQSRREQGVVLISFTIDRQGRLLSSHILRSSGYDLLDAEAMDLLRRAQPFPPPPDDFPGAHVSVTVPIRFNLR